MDEKLSKIPEDLPRPRDDGKSDHLLGMIMPNIILQQTIGNSISIQSIKNKLVILCFFPMMSISEKSLPLGWTDMPGARGCTPQNIEISKHVKDLKKFDALVLGISTQHIDELTKISSERKFLHSLISDNNLEFHKKLKIPAFYIDNKTMYKRMTLVVQDSKIIKVFYPIFPPDKHIFEIIEWLENNFTVQKN